MLKKLILFAALMTSATAYSQEATTLHTPFEIKGMTTTQALDPKQCDEALYNKKTQKTRCLMKMFTEKGKFAGNSADYEFIYDATGMLSMSIVIGARYSEAADPIEALKAKYGQPAVQTARMWVWPFQDGTLVVTDPINGPAYTMVFTSHRAHELEQADAAKKVDF